MRLITPCWWFRGCARQVPHPLCLWEGSPPSGVESIWGAPGVNILLEPLLRSQAWRKRSSNGKSDSLLFGNNRIIVVVEVRGGVEHRLFSVEDYEIQSGFRDGNARRISF